MSGMRRNACGRNDERTILERHLETVKSGGWAYVSGRCLMNAVLQVTLTPCGLPEGLQ